MKAQTLVRFKCGDITIVDTGKVAQIDYGQSISGEEVDAEFRVYDVEGPDVHVQLAYADWETGEVDVRPLSVIAGPRPMDRLRRGGLRLGVYELEDGTSWFELRQARVKTETRNKWSNLFNATTAALDEGAQLDVKALLKKAGARRVGTKAKLLGADNRTRERLCAVYPVKKQIVPVVAFVLTRVLPLRYEYPA